VLVCREFERLYQFLNDNALYIDVLLEFPKLLFFPFVLWIPSYNVSWAISKKTIFAM